MNTQSKTKNYMLVIMAIGFVCLAVALLNLPFEQLDLKFLILFGLTIGFGSRITIQIPTIQIAHCRFRYFYFFRAADVRRRNCHCFSGSRSIFLVVAFLQ